MQNGCAPSDFWQMTPTEVYVYIESKQTPQNYSGMSESDVDELMEMRQGEDFI